MTEEAKKVWEVMETEFGWSNQPQDLHLEYFEDIIKATKQALNIPNVSNCDIIFEEESKFPDEDIDCDATESDIY